MVNTFKIFEGHDHFNNVPLFQVIGINNYYSGEWHTAKTEAKKELNQLVKYKS